MVACAAHCCVFVRTPVPAIDCTSQLRFQLVSVDGMKPLDLPLVLQTDSLNPIQLLSWQ
jgi:hypothetical protein